MEVGHPDHRRPLYLAASINQIPIKRALVDTSASVNLIPLSTLQVTRSSEKKDPRMPDGSNRIRWERRIHHRSHSVLVESGSYSLSSSLPRSQNESILPRTFGEALVTQASTSPVHLSPMCEGKTEWQDDTCSGKPFAIRAGRSPIGRNHVL